MSTDKVVALKKYRYLKSKGSGNVVQSKSSCSTVLRVANKSNCVNDVTLCKIYQQERTALLFVYIAGVELPI